MHTHSLRVNEDLPWCRFVASLVLIALVVFLFEHGYTESQMPLTHSSTTVGMGNYILADDVL